MCPAPDVCNSYAPYLERVVVASLIIVRLLEEKSNYLMRFSSVLATSWVVFPYKIAAKSVVEVNIREMPSGTQ